MSPRHTNSQHRENILAAAGERFRDFGYGKTTMAEIATDCAMSPANLYRYFKNKHDIGAVLATQYLARKESVLRRIIDRHDMMAAERIEAFVLASLRYTHSQWSATPRLYALIVDVSKRRRDIVGHHTQARRALLVELIPQGNASGEFTVANPARTADAILAATVFFDYPDFMDIFPLDLFETKARDVCRLLLEGLRRR
jgi:AcrR family transcriptional regulator